MYETKSLFSSVTFWGGLVSIIPAIPTVITAWATKDAATISAALTPVIGGILAIFGRVTATKRISL